MARTVSATRSRILVARARELRYRATPPEDALWRLLRQGARHRLPPAGGGCRFHR
jgi:hypothetical protein